MREITRAMVINANVKVSGAREGLIDLTRESSLTERKREKERQRGKGRKGEREEARNRSRHHADICCIRSYDKLRD